METKTGTVILSRVTPAIEAAKMIIDGCTRYGSIAVANFNDYDTIRRMASLIKRLDRAGVKMENTPHGWIAVKK